MYHGIIEKTTNLQNVALKPSSALFKLFWKCTSLANKETRTITI